MWVLWGWHRCPECGGKHVCVDNIEWISKKYLSNCCLDCYYNVPVNRLVSHN